MNMNIRQLLRKATKLWCVNDVPANVNRYNRKEWVRAMMKLGDKSLLAKKMERL